MPQTPRLCIDARSPLAEQAIDQLVAAKDEPGAGSPWAERHRTVLVSHPSQLLTGQMKQHSSRWRNRLWEKYFVTRSEVAAFHRFRPIDKTGPSHRCTLITTLTKGRPYLSGDRMPKRLPSGNFIVPCQADADFLHERYGLPFVNISVVRPAPRRYVHYASFSRNKISLAPLTVSSAKEKSVSSWKEELESASWVNYEVVGHFDWPTLALEALYFGVPVIFSEKNAAMRELLPESTMIFSEREKHDLPLKEMVSRSQKDRIALLKSGIFEPLSQARGYREAYEKFLPSTLLGNAASGCE